MTDYESNQGIAFATIIWLAGMIVATALTVVLFALRILAAMETRYSEFNAVIDGAGRIP